MSDTTPAAKVVPLFPGPNAARLPEQPQERDMDIATLYEAWKRAHEAGDVAYEKNRGEEASRLWGEAWDAGDELRALPAERIADVIVQLDTLFGDREADQLGEEDFAFLVKVRDDLARIDGRE